MKKMELTEGETEEVLMKKISNPEVITHMNLWEKRRIEKAMDPSDRIKERAYLDFEKGLLIYFLGKE